MSNVPVYCSNHIKLRTCRAFEKVVELCVCRMLSEQCARNSFIPRHAQCVPNFPFLPQPTRANLEPQSVVRRAVPMRYSVVPEPFRIRLPLQASAPNILQQTITLCQSVQGVVAFAHSTYESAEGVDLALARVSSALIDLAH